MKKKHPLEDIDLTMPSPIKKIEPPDGKHSFFNGIEKDHNERIEYLKDNAKNERNKNRLIKLQLLFFPLLIIISVLGGIFNIYTFIKDLNIDSPQEKTPLPKQEKVEELPKPYISTSPQKKGIVLIDSMGGNNTEKTIYKTDSIQLKK